jgi:hypothetical protein
MVEMGRGCSYTIQNVSEKPNLSSLNPSSQSSGGRSCSTVRATPTYQEEGGLGDLPQAPRGPPSTQGLGRRVNLRIYCREK